jgi:hypothetical protein
MFHSISQGSLYLSEALAFALGPKALFTFQIRSIRVYRQKNLFDGISYDSHIDFNLANNLDPIANKEDLTNLYDNVSYNSEDEWLLGLALQDEDPMIWVRPPGPMALVPLVYIREKARED